MIQIRLHVWSLAFLFLVFTFTRSNKRNVSNITPSCKSIACKYLKNYCLAAPCSSPKNIVLVLNIFLNRPSVIFMKFLGGNSGAGKNNDEGTRDDNTIDKKKNSISKNGQFLKAVTSCIKTLFCGIGLNFLPKKSRVSCPMWGMNIWSGGWPRLVTSKTISPGNTWIGKISHDNFSHTKCFQVRLILIYPCGFITPQHINDPWCLIPSSMPSVNYPHVGAIYERYLRIDCLWISIVNILFFFMFTSKPFNYWSEQPFFELWPIIY